MGIHVLSIKKKNIGMKYTNCKRMDVSGYLHIFDNLHVPENNLGFNIIELNSVNSYQYIQKQNPLTTLSYG